MKKINFIRKGLLLIIGILLANTIVYSQLNAQSSGLEYAYVTVHGKLFSKKLSVTVDFGDEPAQVKLGEQFNSQLTDKTSFVSVLNYMVDNGYELVQAIDYIYISQGTGGTQGLAFLMRQKKEPVIEIKDF